MSDVMTTHSYRTLDVSVDGGDLRVGVWDPEGPRVADVLLIHGVTASHLAWPFVVDRLPGVRAVAPDLRGRGRSNEITGPAGLRAHADDLAATLDALGIEQTVVVGHSMGAFVALVFAHRYPERVSRLLLIDGGLPLDAPAGLDADELVAAILGPTAARLSMRFGGVEDYYAFWRQHPGFADGWSPELEDYIAYDLVPAESGTFRPATSYATTVDDTVDMNTGTALVDALGALAHPTRLITVPRGLQNEPPGLYSPEHLARMLPATPGVRHERWNAHNHYTVVMTAAGAADVAPAVLEEISSAAAS